METLKKIFDWLIDKPIITKVAIVIASAIIALALLLTSCGTARSSVSGSRVVDKHVRDSLIYNVELDKNSK